MIHVGWIVFLLANWVNTPIVFRGPRDKEVKIDRGITFINIPKSSSTLSNLLLLVMQGMMNVLRSFHISRIAATSFSMSVETSIPMLIFSLSCRCLLRVHKSFKNLAYLRIGLIVSSRAMFTSTFLKVSKIFLSTSSNFLLFWTDLYGRGWLIEGCSWPVDCWFELSNQTICNYVRLSNDIVYWCIKLQLLLKVLLYKCVHILMISM